MGVEFRLKRAWRQGSKFGVSCSVRLSLCLRELK